MNCEHVKEIINGIIDGGNYNQCDQSLFKHLADCHDCSDFFNTVAALKKEIKNDAGIFPSDLDEKLFDSLRALNTQKKKSFSFKLLWQKNLAIPVPIGIAFSMLIIILSLFFLRNYDKPKESLLRNASISTVENSSDKVIIIYGMPEILIKDKPIQNRAVNINEGYKIQ